MVKRPERDANLSRAPNTATARMSSLLISLLYQ